MYLDPLLEMMGYPYRSQLIHLIGGALPVLCPIVQDAIRTHLNANYCSVCGEYLKYNILRKKPLRHLHDNYKKRIIRKEKYIPLFLRRFHVNLELMTIEWRRHFHHIQKLPLLQCWSEQYPYHYITMPSKIQALRIWNIDEWNLLYPELAIHPYLRRLQNIETIVENKLIRHNIFFVPDLKFL